MITISESVHNNTEIHIEEVSDHGQGLGDQASHHVQPTFGQMPPIPSELANNIGDPSYWLALVAELMKRIPQVPTETSSKEDKLADRVVWCNLKVYDGSYNPVVLEEWVRGMEKIFIVFEVPEEKKVNIGTYYLTGEADIWWNTVKDKLVGLEFTWNKFLSELKAKFYPTMVQRQKQKEFMELKMSGTMTVMKYVNKFIKLSWFVPEFVLSERLKMRRFKEGLTFYIRNQLAG